MYKINGGQKHSEQSCSKFYHLNKVVRGKLAYLQNIHFYLLAKTQRSIISVWKKKFKKNFITLYTKFST